jgi:hypothetical protein
MEMTLRGRRERNLDLPFLPRPRSLETRKQRGFPHSHRDDCCCDPLELKPEPRMNTGDVTDSCTEPKERTGARENDEFLAPTQLNWLPWGFFYLKSAMMFVAYAWYIIPFLVSKVRS